MTKEELTKELELLADSCDSNYALETNGYNRGVLDALDLVNKNFDLALVSGRSELLFAFIAEIKREFKDENWDYLDFIAERVLKANNSH